jgi:hypothetical protein
MRIEDAGFQRSRNSIEGSMRNAEVEMKWERNWRIGALRQPEPHVWRVMKTVMSTQDFVTSVIERHSAQNVTASHVEMALAQLSSSQANYFKAISQLDVAANLAFHEQTLYPVVRDRSSNVESSERYSDAKAAALFEKLFSRRSRISAPVSTEVTRVHEARGNSPAPKMPDHFKLVQQERASDRCFNGNLVRVGSTHESPAPKLDSGWGTPAVFPQATVSPALPPNEVRRVADQVIREIDRRVVANRERMGRR